MNKASWELTPTVRTVLSCSGKAYMLEVEQKLSCPISSLLPCALSSWFPLINAFWSKTFLGADSLPSLFWELLSQDPCTLNQEWKTHLVLHWTAERGTQNVAPMGKSCSTLWKRAKESLRGWGGASCSTLCTEPSVQDSAEAGSHSGLGAKSGKGRLSGEGRAEVGVSACASSCPFLSCLGG